MTDPTEIIKMERFFRDHPGCTFTFHPAGESFGERFCVSVPLSPVHGGMIWGEGATLDAAYCIAAERRDDRLNMRRAA